MFTLVTGGSASGKREYAEQWVTGLSGTRIYLATMEIWDEECRRRVEKHRAARAGRGFVTVERPYDLMSLDFPGEIPEDANVLLEDLGNLLANERYREWEPAAENHSEELVADRLGKSLASVAADRILRGIRYLSAHSRHLTIVTNEVFSGGDRYDPETLAYMRDLAQLNRKLAAEADRVVEVVCGLPNVLK